MGPHQGLLNGHGDQSETEVAGRVKKKSLANMFLPANNQDAVLVLKKVNRDVSRKSSFDSGIGLQDDDGKSKRPVAKMASTDKNEQCKLTAELVQRLTFIASKMADLPKCMLEWEKTSGEAS